MLLSESAICNGAVWQCGKYTIKLMVGLGDTWDHNLVSNGVITCGSWFFCMRIKSFTILGIAANSIKYNHCDLTTNSEMGDNFFSRSCKRVSTSDPSAWILIDSGSGWTKVISMSYSRLRGIPKSLALAALIRRPSISSSGKGAL